ncbi:MAG: S41 family peptidase [Bacteroidia bacterium]
MEGRLQSKLAVSLVAILTQLVLGCTSRENLSNNEKYVIQAFDSIEVYSRHRLTFNLDSLKTQVLNQISDSTSHEEVIKLLEYAIKTIDRHNYIITAEKFHQMNTGTNSEVLMNPYPFQHKMLQQKYAYISLDGFIGVDSMSAKNYTDSLQRSIQRLYNQQPKGWIIDLRNNTGGWIYPMLAGLGPLLGSGIKAFEISGNQVLEEYYFYKDTSDFLLLSDSIWFFENHLPLAVLVSEETGSAGELLTLSFRGNTKTAIIGTPTAGFSTGLRGFIMPDSTQICVTNCIMTDRNKKGDGGRIPPDIIEYDPIQMFEQAYKWIESKE